MDAAITAALEAEALDRAENLIRAACGPAIKSGLAATVVRWVSGLPAESVERSPELSLVLARASASRGDLLLAGTALEAARRSCELRPVPWLRIGILHLGFIVHLAKGALCDAVEEIDDALRFFATEPEQPELAMFGIDEEALVVYGAVAKLLTGQLEPAIAATERVLTPSRLVHPTKATVLGVGIRSLALAWAGRDAEAAQCIANSRRVVMQYAGSTGDPLPFHLAEAWITEGAAADRIVSAARVIVEDQGTPIYRLVFALTEARHALRRGRRAAASHSLAEAGSLLATMQGAAFLGRLAEDMRLELEAVHRAGMSEALNPREVEILTEIAAGSSRREAAHDLHLSINTVKTYLRTAYRKLGVTDRHDAVIEARRLGLIDGSDTPSRTQGLRGHGRPA